MATEQLTLTQPTPDTTTAAHGERETAQEASLPHSCRCQARWAGMSTAHCATCHLTFTGPSAFDTHRRGGECTTPGDAGLIAHQRAGYLAFGRPGDDTNTARLAATRKNAPKENPQP